jgi:hypothetical protein
MFLTSTNRRCERFRSGEAYWVISQLALCSPNDGLFARFYRHPGSAILLQKQVSKASIAKIVGVSLPPFTALSRQGGYAHTLKGYFYANLGGDPKTGRV